MVESMLYYFDDDAPQDHFRSHYSESDEIAIFWAEWLEAGFKSKHSVLYTLGENSQFRVVKQWSRT